MDDEALAGDLGIPPLSNPNRLLGPIKGLDYLTQEIPQEIIDQIGDILLAEADRAVANSSLASLSRTSRKLNTAFEARLYRHNIHGDDPRYSPLIWGITNSSMDVVKKAISYGEDVNAVHSDTRLNRKGSPIHYAAVAGDNAIIQYLIDHGARLDTGCRGFCHAGCDNKFTYYRVVERDWYPLHLAMCHEKLSTAELLMRNGVPFAMYATDDPGTTVNEPLGAIHCAAAFAQPRLITAAVELARTGQDGWHEPGVPQELQARTMVNRPWHFTSPMTFATHSLSTSNKFVGVKETIDMLVQLGASLDERYLGPSRLEAVHDEFPALRTALEFTPSSASRMLESWEAPSVLLRHGATVGWWEAVELGYTHISPGLPIITRALAKPEGTTWARYNTDVRPAWLSAKHAFIQQVFEMYPELSGRMNARSQDKQEHDVYPFLTLCCLCCPTAGERKAFLQLFIRLGADVNACFNGCMTALGQCVKDYAEAAIVQTMDSEAEALRLSMLLGLIDCMVILLGSGASLELGPVRSCRAGQCHERHPILRAIDLTTSDSSKTRSAGTQLLAVFLHTAKHLSRESRLLIETRLNETTAWEVGNMDEINQNAASRRTDSGQFPRQDLLIPDDEPTYYSCHSCWETSEGYGLKNNGYLELNWLASATRN
ncbi:Ankyrin repeat-containing domain protein [Naviculisporaceae sp. PSN 640]